MTDKDSPVGGTSRGDQPTAAGGPFHSAPAEAHSNEATVRGASGDDFKPDDATISPSGDKLNLAQVAGSMIAAGLGVQSSKNRERDFKQGRFGVFVAAGLIFTLMFIGTVFTVVQLVLKGAGD
jgi:hypothetical protein